MSAVQFGSGNGRRVAVLRRPADRVQRPPEVEVVLVVPGVDRRVGRRQVLHREETGAVGGVEVIPCDELAGDVVPARDGVALPPLGDVRLLVRAGGAGRPAASPLTSLKSVRLCGAVERGWTSGAELRRALHQERLHAADPRGRVVAPRAAEARPVSRARCSAPTETARTVHRPVLASIMACAAAVPAAIPMSLNGESGIAFFDALYCVSSDASRAALSSGNVML